MPFKKPNREYYYTWPTLPGFGRVGPWSTGTRDKRRARAMEDYLRELSLSRPELVRGIVERKYTLRDLWAAKLEGRVDDLAMRARDPSLASVVDRFRPLAKDRRIENGLDHLLDLAPPGARLSWLLEPKNISNACAKMVEAGQRPNSVRRSLYRAISDLLAYEIGKKRRAQILADVVKPGEDDTRHVEVTPGEIRRILELCDHEMRPVVQAAILTGIDRGPLAQLRARHFNEAAGTLLVPDTKTSSRWRTIPLSRGAQALFRKQVAGKGPEARIFSVSYSGMDNRWRTVRRKAGRDDLRFKDLRHVFATFYVQAGGTMADLGQILGHTNRETTLKYTAAQTRAQREQMDRAAQAMGLDVHLSLSRDAAG